MSLLPEALAERLYQLMVRAGPLWSQLGPVTRSVWLERAALKRAGVTDWWSIRHTPEGKLMNAACAPRFRGTIQECMNMSLNHKAIAAQLSIIGTAYLALEGYFRAASGDAGEEGGDAPASKPVRGGKSAPASKPAAKKAQAEPADADLSIDEVREKLKELVAAKGKEKMVEALESVGAGKLADVDESQYQELVDKAQEFIDEDDEPAPAKKPAAKKGKKAGPTIDEVNEAAKALIAADKPAYMKLTKKLGKPSEMDEADYAAAIAAYEEAMPEEGGEDDELL